MKLRNLLTETLDSPEKFISNVPDENHYSAKFKIGKISYSFSTAETFIKNFNSWGVFFKAEGYPEKEAKGVINTGNVGKVFATAIAVIKDFISKKNPELVTFFADDLNKGRIKLYNRFIKNAGKFFPNYFGIQEEESFALVRKDKRKFLGK